MPYTPSGGYYELDFRGRAVKAGSPTHPGIERGRAMRRVAAKRFLNPGFGKPGFVGPATRAYKAGRPDIAARMGPRTGRYAVLICFDGPQAQQAAEDYLKYLTMMIKANAARVSTPQDRARLTHLKAYPCCLALHDCVKHPLNPRG